MEVLKNYFGYLAKISFVNWQETFIKLFILMAMVFVLLWLMHAIFNRFGMGNKQEYKAIRDFNLDVNLLWAFGIVFALFSGFWTYVLFHNGINALKYDQSTFWLGLVPILTNYLILIVLFIIHYLKTNKKIKI